MTIPLSTISAGAWPFPTSTSASCCRIPASHRNRRPSIARRWRSSRGWRTSTPPSSDSARTWHSPTSTSACYSRKRTGRRKRQSSTARRWRSSRRSPTTTRPSPRSAVSWRAATPALRGCCFRWERQRSLRPNITRRWQFSRSWPTKTRPLPISAPRGREPRQPRHRAIQEWQGVGSGVRAPQGSGTFQKLAGENPTVTRFRRSLAHGHYNLGLLLAKTGKPSEAEAEYREAWRSWRRWPTTTPPKPNSSVCWPQAIARSAT